MIKTVFKILNLLALLLATAWVVLKFDWEPLIVFITLLASFIVLIFSNDNVDAINADKNLYEKFNNVLPNDIMDWIDKMSFEGIFLIENMDAVFDFVAVWRGAHNTFLNKKLENKKNRLYKAIDEFTTIIAENTFSADDPRFHCVPKEWAQNDKQKYDEVCQKIRDTKKEVTASYYDFIKTAKTILKV